MNSPASPALSRFCCPPRARAAPAGIEPRTSGVQGHGVNHYPTGCLTRSFARFLLKSESLFLRASFSFSLCVFFFRLCLSRRLSSLDRVRILGGHFSRGRFLRGLQFCTCYTLTCARVCQPDHCVRASRPSFCRDPGSNRGPSDLRSDALPVELSRLLEK